MWAESARPVGRGSTVAQKDNTSLVVLTEGLSSPPCLRAEVSMRSKMAKRQDVFLKLWSGAAHTLHTLENGMKPQLQF